CNDYLCEFCRRDRTRRFHVWWPWALTLAALRTLQFFLADRYDFRKTIDNVHIESRGYLSPGPIGGFRVLGIKNYVVVSPVLLVRDLFFYVDVPVYYVSSRRPYRIVLLDVAQNEGVIFSTTAKVINAGGIEADGRVRIL